MKYKIIEKFISINGEGLKAGQLAVFIRLAGCNLRCKYCDTKYSFNANAAEEMTTREILNYLSDCGIKNVTLTGGEPMIHQGIVELIEDISTAGYSVELETNGSIDISAVAAIVPRIGITLDYKTASSGMKDKNYMDNYKYLTKKDCVKFVVGSKEDLDVMVGVTRAYDLLKKSNVIISPVFGMIQPRDIVEYMKDHGLNGYRLQLQLHKFIWPPEERGV